MEHQATVRVIGPMPPYYEVAYAVWGNGCDFDSDGNSYERDSDSWRELTIIERPELQKRLDIDPLENNRDLLWMRANDRIVLQKALDFLIRCGAVSQDA